MIFRIFNCIFLNFLLGFVFVTDYSNISFALIFSNTKFWLYLWPGFIKSDLISRFYAPYATKTFSPVS